MHLAAIAAITLAAQPLKPVPHADVAFTGDFWGQRLAAILDGALETNFQQCEATGRIENFAKAAGQIPGKSAGFYFNDSDVYKAIEGAAYQLAILRDSARRTELDRYLDGLIAQIAAAQQPDGYINTYYTTTEPENRWTNTAVRHEMYCIGHLIEAAVAHHQATGKRSLLEVAIKAADHVDALFGPPPKRPDIPGHQELELALIRLADLTGETRYLRLAEHFINSRGISLDGRKLYGDYCQDHAPLREQTEVRGHAVRAMYLFTAATELAMRTGEKSLIAALGNLWEDLVSRKMYITGGIGNSGHNEGFTTAYDLPNDSAYAETCATIGLAFWAHRMNLLHADAGYFDVLERALYNGILSGVSADGRRFFYENPLGSSGDHHRQDWYPCACCPPNILRFFSSLGGYAAATGDRTAYLNLFATGRIVLRDAGVALVVKTAFPWEGEVQLAVEALEGAAPPENPWDLAIRVPSWAGTIALRRGLSIGPSPAPRNGYTRLEGFCTPGNSIIVVLPMVPRKMLAHPAILADRGHMAVQRGPIVYCLESADNTAPVRSLIVAASQWIRPEWNGELLGGVTVITSRAQVISDREDWAEGPLYRPNPPSQEVPITFVPYFGWDNRKPGEMLVWIPESPSVLPILPAPGVTPSASHCWGTDTVLALCDRLEPAGSNDHAMPRHTWWPRRGSTEWVQLDFDRPRSLSGLSVYWFDDGPPSGSGGCRVPAAWRILYRDGDGWKPVPDPAGLTVEKDRYNTARFGSITTTAIRIEADLREGYSGGVLEIKTIR